MHIATQLCIELQPAIPVCRLLPHTRLLARTQMVRSLALAPDGGALVLGGVQRSVYIVHTETGKTAELTGHCGPVVAAAYSADGRHFMTAAGCTLMVWDGAAEAQRVEPSRQPKVMSQVS